MLCWQIHFILYPLPTELIYPYTNTASDLVITCIIIWFFRCEFPKKVFSHSLHYYGFSSVCISKWLVRSLFLEKVFLTICIFIRLFSSVCPNVAFQIGLIRANHITVFALKWFIYSYFTLIFHPDGDLIDFDYIPSICTCTYTYTCNVFCVYFQISTN